jgi:ureidoglycolate dehydrogenase (NAD+)
MDRLPAPLISAAIRDLLVSRGLPGPDARDVATTLVETSLIGVDTHGIRLLPTYIQELDGGRAKCRPTFRVLGDFPAVGIFDAGHALGVVAANAAMREVIERASRCGIAALAVANSNHFGAAGYYARMAVPRGQVGLVFSNSDALVTPHGGTAALNGTNPIAMAAPGLDDDGFCLDMATSEVAYSRVMHELLGSHAGRRATAMPTVPPLGGYKGQGLGTMVQILCALLADMPLDADLTHLYDQPYDSPRRVSHFMSAIDLRAFVDPAKFRSRLSGLLDSFRNSPASCSDPVLVAGDLERRTKAERLRDGVPIEAAQRELLEPFLQVQPAL